MKRFEAILSSTQVDLHGERMTKGALESAASVLRSHYVQMGVEHDPRQPPIGRFTEAWIEDMPDGQAILKGAGDLFEPGDQLPESIEKTIVEREYPPGSVTISYDRTYDSNEDKEDVEDLATRLGGTSRQEIKKALDPLSVLAIGAGGFVLGQIASGFFSQIGADAYSFLKTKVTALLRRQKPKSKEQILSFEFSVSAGTSTILIQTLLINPDDAQIQSFLDDTIYDLDKLHTGIFHERHQLSRAVYFYEEGKLVFKYAVRRDGFPVTFKGITEPDGPANGSHPFRSE